MMSHMPTLRLSIGILLLLLPLSSSLAHPGNTAADGCHYCRTNCEKWGVPYGERHCHRSKGIPQPSEPIRSHRGEPKGYTTPAPDYKLPAPKAKNTSPRSETPQGIVSSLSSEADTSMPAPQKEKGGKGLWKWIFSIFK